MKALAKGKNEEVILKLLKNLVGSTQGVSLSILFILKSLYQNYHETFLDDEGIKDVADVIKTEKPLFAEGEDPSMLDCGDMADAKVTKKSTGKRSDAFAGYEKSILEQMRAKKQ